MDGPWQIGHKTADEYGRLATETARRCGCIDPRSSSSPVARSNSRMPTFAAWEQTVLDTRYDPVDYVSLHAYYEAPDGESASFLASTLDMDRLIDRWWPRPICRREAERPPKKMKLSFDEWNVWYTEPVLGDGPVPRRASGCLSAADGGPVAVTDAVVVGTLLNSLLRHSDRVTSAVRRSW